MGRKGLCWGMALSLIAASGAAAQDPEDAAVRAAVDHYLQGHATGDGAHHRMVFHDVANLFWIDGTTLRTRTGAENIAGSPGKRALDEGWTGYGPTAGYPEFREMIAAYVARTRGKAMANASRETTGAMTAVVADRP